ncbi:MAG: hypothetical protein M3N82_11235 [Pseudomonadota bacterium]|nr:hypothetical protein [Pseudomonadota bacterium]
MNIRTLRILLVAWPPVAILFTFMDGEFDLEMMWIGSRSGGVCDGLR